jgi:hypothetical protein
MDAMDYGKDQAAVPRATERDHYVDRDAETRRAYQAAVAAAAADGPSAHPAPDSSPQPIPLLPLPAR